LVVFKGWGFEFDHEYITSIYIIAKPKVIFHFKLFYEEN
jgi:hypothetical protein